MPTPFLVRRGIGIKRISAKPTLTPQTGWSLTISVTAPIIGSKYAERFD